LNAAKKIILLLWLLIVASLGNVSASTPGATENRTWEKSLATTETRLVEPLQTLGGHQENGGAGYDYAVDCLLAAETTAGGNLLTQGSLVTDSSRLLSGVSGSANDIVVIGRQVDTAVAADWQGYKVLNIQNWSLQQNDAFIQAAINQRQTFYLGSPVNYQTLWNPNFNSMTVFGRELGQIYQAGYQQVGLHLVPPPLP